MRKIIAAFTLMVATAPVLLAGRGPYCAPEIHASTGMGALILIAGAVLISRGQRKVQS